MTKKHIADGEGDPFLVINIAPDFCIVDGSVVPFEIVQYLGEEQATYAETVFARGHKVLTEGSVLRGVLGDAGEGVISGCATSGGSCVIFEGHGTIFAEGKPVARHGHLVRMNCS